MWLLLPGAVLYALRPTKAARVKTQLLVMNIVPLTVLLILAAFLEDSEEPTSATVMFGMALLISVVPLYRVRRSVRQEAEEA